MQIANLLLEYVDKILIGELLLHFLHARLIFEHYKRYAKVAILVFVLDVDYLLFNRLELKKQTLVYAANSAIILLLVNLPHYIQSLFYKRVHAAVVVVRVDCQQVIEAVLLKSLTEQFAELLLHLVRADFLVDARDHDSVLLNIPVYVLLLLSEIEGTHLGRKHVHVKIGDEADDCCLN